MQGRLRGEHLRVDIQTECGHCGRQIDLAVDSDLRFTVRQPDCAPLIFEPEIDWGGFRSPTIVDDY